MTSSRHLSVVVAPSALVALVALGLAAPARAHNVRLTIASARLDGASLPAGLQRSTAHISDLTCWSLPGLRALGDLCARGTPPAAASPVDALVRLEIGDAVVRTYPVPSALAPQWDYAVILDGDFLHRGGDAVFELLDYQPDGSEKRLGSARVAAAHLLDAGTRTIAVGAHHVTYRVELLPDAQPPRRYSFRVPADRQMGDLARVAPVASTSTSGRYVLMPVAEGELVEVTATGKVQPSVRKHPALSCGPDGLPTVQAKVQYNEPGFRGAGQNHAALIGQIGPTGFVLGSHGKITVEKAGLLLLAINDLSVTDNAGGYDVEVIIREPVVTPEAVAPAMRKGSKADRAAAAMDPRVVEQIVDAHQPEIEACLADAADPYGDIVLAFAISGDGSLLGVTVEKAPPNLKPACDCMRKKALVWRFPPPRGTVTVRYPMRFAAG